LARTKTAGVDELGRVREAARGDSWAEDAALASARPRGSAPNRDDVFVMDASGVDVPGSPFSARALQDRTIQIAGDTVQVRLRSIPGDLRADAGPLNGPGNWLNVVAVDPANRPPIVVAAVTPAKGYDPPKVLVDLRGSSDPDG
jgi:hypothetical protein